ncbi:PREDICTED: natural killer cells antigen CD94-like, partial [Buceros rhinoceros silvestris]|uniref:natural killer cells antigen CD94-like n=1 Tax=Buceros rhinoceros silvestris TaxID=175836 RepID=UPI00052941B0
CCPLGWVLYRSKCLFVSVEKKTWWDSRDDCRKRSSQLLVQGDWPSWTVPHFVQYHAMYWVGVQYSSDAKKTLVWLDSKQAHLYHHPTDCGLSDNRKIGSSKCSKKYQWICEQPPKLSSISKTLLPLLFKD